MLAIDKDGSVAIVTLRRAEITSTDHHSIRAALCEALSAVAADDSVSVILLTGKEDGFPDGLDVAALGAQPLAGVEDAANPALVIRQCAKPVIAAITGAAIAGGLEIVMACDLVIASTNARFADTHLHVGVDPGPWLAKRLEQMMGPQRALEMSLTGAFIEAEMAYEWDLIGRLTAPEALVATALHVAHEMARAPLEALVRRKALTKN